MIQLICHMFGDYVLQNHAMAIRKRSSWRWASLHVAFYSLPFLVVLRPSWAAMLVIAGTHLLIDRFSLAGYWVRFWGIGCPGVLPSRLREWLREDYRCDRLANQPDLSQEIPDEEYDRDYPPLPPPPDYLSVWLGIVADNTFHLAINAVALAWL